MFISPAALEITEFWLAERISEQVHGASGIFQITEGLVTRKERAGKRYETQEKPLYRRGRLEDMEPVAV